MERNSVTTISKLKLGDRFYKAGDKNKKVLEKFDHAVKQTRFQTYSHFAVPASVIDTLKPGHEVLSSYIMAMKSDTELIFLRHKI